MDEMTMDLMTPEETEFLREVTTEENSVEECAVPDDEVSADEDTVEDYLRLIGELEEKLRRAENEKTARERELRCLSLLGEAGLPSELMSAVILSEDMGGTVETIRRTVQSLVDAEVSKRCRSDTPETGTRAPISKEELMRMPVAELQRLRDSGFMSI